MKRLAVFSLVIPVLFFSCEESVSPVDINGFTQENPPIGAVNEMGIAPDEVAVGITTPSLIKIVEVVEVPTLADQSAVSVEELFGGRAPQVVGEISRDGFGMAEVNPAPGDLGNCLLLECQRSIDETTNYLQGLAIHNCETMFMTVSCCNSNGPVNLVISVAPLCPDQLLPIDVQGL